MPSIIATVQTLEGAATYKGPATGKYVRKEFDANGNPEHLYGGQFTATAELNAYFVGDDVAANKHNRIEGMITTFMDNDEMIDERWKVMLNMAPYDSAATGLSSAGEFSGTTSTSDDEEGMSSGNWHGQFFGEVILDTDDATTGNQSKLPSGVAGEFNGHFTNGHVLGAFGATQNEME